MWIQVARRRQLRFRSHVERLFRAGARKAAAAAADDGGLCDSPAPTTAALPEFTQPRKQDPSRSRSPTSYIAHVVGREHNNTHLARVAQRSIDCGSQSQAGREYIPGVGANHRQGESMCVVLRTVAQALVPLRSTAAGRSNREKSPAAAAGA
eukprot:5008260-Pyramimonas_sp.AAC.1